MKTPKESSNTPKKKNSSVLASSSMHLSLLDSTKKRLREEDDGQEGTPSKRRQNDEEENREGMEKETYETRRGRILSELFGYDKIWCEYCVMMPCICLANNIELKIVKET